MKRFYHSALAVGVCFMCAIGVFGQIQSPTRVRAGDEAAPVARPVEPDSPGTSSTVAAGPQANGASPGTIVPRLMKFSGVLRNATGKPLTGTVDVTFSLYSTEAGGSPLWFEAQSVQADELGRYTALLGAMHTDGLPIDLFTSGEVRWLGIQVGSEAEQQPRVLLVSVPYALKAGDAETLGGKPASAYTLSDSENGTASTAASSAATANTAQTGASGRTRKSQTTNKSALTACSSVTSDGTASLNSIALFKTACGVQSSVLTQFNGNLGFGTTTPQARLHIFGPDSSDSNARYNLILSDSTPAAAGTGGGILFSGYYNGTTNKAGFANIRGVKENATQGDYASALIFDTRVNGGNQTERMRISSTGYIGIGTSTPTAMLDVAGNVNIPQTTGVTAGIISIGGLPFIDACCTGQAGNTFVGVGAGNLYTTGAGNTATGTFALDLNTTGAQNTASGGYALDLNTTGISNTASGAFTMHDNTTGSYNTASGSNSLSYNDTGRYDSAFGTCALLNTVGTSRTTTPCSFVSLASGSGDTALGFSSGHSNTTGQINTFLGFGADASSGALTNATAIGANALVGESNALVLGSINGVNGATASVNVGIGTSAPATALQVASGDAYLSAAGNGVILKSPDGTKCRRLTIDNTGAIALTALTCP